MIEPEKSVENTSKIEKTEEKIETQQIIEKNSVKTKENAENQENKTKPVKKSLLHTLDQQVEEQKIEQKPFPIDPELFTKAYSKILNNIESSLKSYLQSILEKQTYVIEGTDWIQKVSSDFDVHVLEQEREQIVSFLRKETKNPWIVMKAIVDEDLAKNIPKFETEEEKFRKLMDEYPILLELWEKFQLKLLR